MCNYYGFDVDHCQSICCILMLVDCIPTPEVPELRILLSQDGHFPSRRTWERRLKAIPESLPAQIACLGRYLLQLINPWEHIRKSSCY